MAPTTPRTRLYGTAEAIVGMLLPPACREEVQGDLHERCRGAGEYAAAALRALPLLIASHVRRNTDLRIFLLTAYATVYSFTAAGFRTEQLSVADDPWALLRIAIPSIAALLALLLRNAWAGREERTQLASTVDIGIAMTFAYLSQVVLSVIKPELSLPRWCPSQGAFVGWLFLSMVRAMFPPHPPCPHEPCRPEEFETDVCVTNRRVCVIAALLLAVFTAVFIFSGVTRVRIGAACIVAGTLCMVWQIRGNGSGVIHGAKDFSAQHFSAQHFSAQLRRQHALLRRAWLWYLWSFLPGCVLLFMNAGIYPCYVFMYVFLFGELIHRAVRSMRLDIVARHET